MNLIEAELQNIRLIWFKFLPSVSRVLSIFEGNIQIHGPVTLHGHTAGYRSCSLLVHTDRTTHTLTHLRIFILTTLPLLHEKCFNEHKPLFLLLWNIWKLIELKCYCYHLFSSVTRPKSVPPTVTWTSNNNRKQEPLVKLSAGSPQEPRSGFSSRFFVSPTNVTAWGVVLSKASPTGQRTNESGRTHSVFSAACSCGLYCRFFQLPSETSCSWRWRRKMWTDVLPTMYSPVKPTLFLSYTGIMISLAAAASPHITEHVSLAAGRSHGSLMLWLYLPQLCVAPQHVMLVSLWCSRCSMSHFLSSGAAVLLASRPKSPVVLSPNWAV